MELRHNGSLQTITRDDYSSAIDQLKHLFLVGDLKKPEPHPFFRDDRLEMIICTYQPGDHGIFHWHREITEYSYVIEGALTYFEIGPDRTHVLMPGDFFIIPPGLCVGLEVDRPTRAITIKVPSNNEKTYCPDCQRECKWRITP